MFYGRSSLSFSLQQQLDPADKAAARHGNADDLLITGVAEVGHLQEGMNPAFFPCDGQVPDRIGGLLKTLSDANARPQQQFLPPSSGPLKAGIVHRIVEDVFGFEPVQGRLCAREQGPAELQLLATERLPRQRTLHPSEVQPDQVASLPGVAGGLTHIVDGIVLVRVEDSDRCDRGRVWIPVRAGLIIPGRFRLQIWIAQRCGVTVIKIRISRQAEAIAKRNPQF